VLLVIVARSASNVEKLWAIVPCAVTLVRAFSSAPSERLAGATGSRSVRAIRRREQFAPHLFHMPLDIVREHREQDVRAHTVFQMVVDGAHVQIDGLEGAKSALDSAEKLVGVHRVVRR